MKEHVYMSRDPIVCGVKVEAGVVKTGTPICVPSKEFIYIGVCTGIQHNSKDVETAMLTSRISRESIDACKDYFRDELTKSDWALMA